MRKTSFVLFAVLVLMAVLPLGVAQAQEAVTVELTTHETLGPILTDADGMTMYLFTVDERNVSNCAGGCANAWPPVLASGDPVAGEGVTETALATITRDDGDSQVTYNGWPLYYFAQDAAAGDANGQNVNDVWFVVSSSGGPIQNSAPVNVSAHPTLGNILVDISGRTQYLFTPDERGVSNCAGPCALAWPPLLTVGDPVAGDGVTARALGTTDRGDGTIQVTYNGWPLYYFAFDNKPGDINGQDSRSVWYAVSTDGGAIWNSATIAIADHAELGPILADSKGRILYLFSPDLPNKSVCAGGCALAWPPVVTIDAPLAGDGVDARQLGTITRDDGYTQVTFGAQPLYYFAFDDKPGDARGQDSGNVWFVLSAAGDGIIPPVTGDLSLTTAALAALVMSVALLSAGGFMLRRRAVRRVTIA